MAISAKAKQALEDATELAIAEDLAGEAKIQAMPGAVCNNIDEIAGALRIILIPIAGVAGAAAASVVVEKALKLACAINPPKK